MKANPKVDFQIMHVGLIDAVICTSLPIEGATARLNREYPTGISSKWAYDGKKKNRAPCSDEQGKMHYRLFC